MKINEFIKEYYDVVYSSQDVDAENLDNVKTFLLGDDPILSGSCAVNSLFINQFSKKEDAVLVEEIPSMRCIDRDEAFQSVWLSTEASIIGWDTGSIGEISESTTLRRSRELEVKMQILARKLLDPDSTSDKEEIKVQLQETFATFRSMTGELFSLLSNKDVWDNIRNSFPARTESMENTLLKACEVSDRVFLIANKLHLKKETGLYFLVGGFEYSLDGFYEFLHSRNTVILMPKSEKVLEMKDNTSLRRALSIPTATSLDNPS